MIRRYNLSHPAGQPMPEDWIHLPYSVVAAADYDALAARLAEAERLIQEVATISSDADVSNCIDEARRLLDDKFLRPADSAPAQESESNG